MKRLERPEDQTHMRREKILALLVASEGAWCSGEAISDELGISRAAVAKYVAGLREAGHGIDSAPRRGYRLMVKADELSAQSVQALLRTHTLGQKAWRDLRDTTSTNREAMLWAIAGAETGCIVLAERQSQGRGRKGRQWFSVPRAVQFSIILRPTLPVAEIELVTLLTQLGTLAVTEAIRQCTPLTPDIKSPNDVLLNGRKICGVLTEVGLQAGELDWAVLGIGCNVNALPQEFDDALRPLASSLLIEGGQAVSRSALLACVLERIEFWYERLCAGNGHKLEKQWNALVGKHEAA